MAADNDPTIVDASGTARRIRMLYLGTDASARDVWVQGAVVEIPEQEIVSTNVQSRYTVTTTATALSAPAGAKYARLRVHDSGWDPATASTQGKRLFYVQDGSTPTTNGANARGWLYHGEAMLVRLSNFGNFRMIGDASGHSWDVAVEWLTWPTG
jgi:hypothetical protein